MADDQATAQTGATAEAVRNVFTQPGAGYALYGCDTGEFDTSTCNLRNRATQGYASITAEKARSAGSSPRLHDHRRLA